MNVRPSTPQAKWIVGTQRDAAERHAANRDVPVFLAHGSADNVIPIGLARASRAALVAMGHDVDWHEYPMPHSVCAEEIDALGRWLRARLG